MAKKGQKYRTFSRKQKLNAVKMVIEEEKSLNEDTFVTGLLLMSVT